MQLFFKAIYVLYFLTKTSLYNMTNTILDYNNMTNTILDYNNMTNTILD